MIVRERHFRRKVTTLLKSDVVLSDDYIAEVMPEEKKASSFAGKKKLKKNSPEIKSDTRMAEKDQMWTSSSVSSVRDE